jgi:hypothetical protein
VGAESRLIAYVTPAAGAHLTAADLRLYLRERLPDYMIPAGFIGFQTPNWDKVPSPHLYHAVAALKRTGQDFTARMIAAEALSRT